MIKGYGDHFQSAVLSEPKEDLRVIVAKNDQEMGFPQGLAAPLGRR